MRRAASILLLIPCAFRIFAAQVITLDITYRKNTFDIDYEAVLYAPTENVYALLTDYGNWANLSNIVKTSSVSSRDHRLLVRNVMQGCVLFYCRDVTQVLAMEENGKNMVRGEIVPELSDFGGGHATWQLINEGNRTRVHYHASMTPAFWIPPLIGPWAIEQALHEDLRATTERVEQLAKRDDNSHLM